jgi:hypothetical protein
MNSPPPPHHALPLGQEGAQRRGSRRVPVTHRDDGDALVPGGIFSGEVDANGVVRSEGLRQFFGVGEHPQRRVLALFTTLI